jgi:CP family cyanate transporter-like MFS transporter
LLFVSLLRSPITAIPPLLGRISADLGMNSVEMGALTSVPVLCFGVLTPVASVVMRRLDLNSSALWTLAIIMAGAIVRSTGTIWAAFLGTAVIAAGMTMGNLIAPMVIARNFRKRTALMTGAYSASINIAVTLSTALAMPLALLIGWQGSAAAWAIIPGMIVGIVWWRVFPPHDGRGQRQDAVTSAPTAAPKLTTISEPAEPSIGNPQPRARIAAWPLAWIMATAFAGHNFAYYSTVGWLPTALHDVAGMGESGAGVASSVFQITAVLGPMLVPLLMSRFQWPMLRIMIVICASWLTLPFGMLAAPNLWFVWCVFGGMAQGAFFSALFTVVIQRTRTPDESRRLTALIQTTGYIVAATGPVLVGHVHDAVGGWTLPFAIIGVGTIVMTVCGIIAVSDTSTPPEK